tara:strand:+ start:779 stop:1366 length:588 start_codon:yes stop_codon:yes gene_type:complete
MSDEETVKVFNEEIPAETETQPTASGIADKTPVAVEKEESSTVEVAPKKTKKKRVLTDEEKERLKQNLAKGRATSLANRRKKAQLKKIALEEKSKDEDEKIFQAYKKKRKPAELMDENESLKKQLAEMKMQMESSKKQEIIKPVKVKEKREPKVKTAETEDSDDEPAPKKTAKPVTPAPKKEMTKREIMKMMRGL